MIGMTDTCTFTCTCTASLSLCSDMISLLCHANLLGIDSLIGIIDSSCSPDNRPIGICQKSI